MFPLISFRFRKQVCTWILKTMALENVLKAALMAVVYQGYKCLQGQGSVFLCPVDTIISTV